MEHWARGRQFEGRADFLCISVVGERTAMQFKASLRLDRVILAFVDGASPRFGQLGCSGFIVLNPDGTVADPSTPAFLDLGEQAFRELETLVEKLCEPDFEWPVVLAAKSVSELRGLARDRRIDTQACIEKKEIVEAIVMDSISKMSSGKLKRLLQKEGVDTTLCLERADYVGLILSHKTESATGSGVSTADMPSFESASQCPDGTCKKPLPVKKPPCKKAKTCSSMAQSPFQVSSLPSVGNQIMDEEHAECINALNQLAKNQTSGDLKQVLSVFGEHFQHEEELMTIKGFGGDLTDSFSAKASHQRDHNNILAKIRKIYDRTSIDPKEKVGIEEVKTISELLERHARNFDVLYEGHL